MDIAWRAPPYMGFSIQEYWSGLPFPSPEDLSDPGIEPRSPALQADSYPPSHQGIPQYLFTKLLLEAESCFQFTYGLAMAPHSSTLAWKIPWMEEPGRLQSMGSLRVGHY